MRNHNLCFLCTVNKKFQNYHKNSKDRGDRSGQTVPVKLRLLTVEQSDQSLQCLPFGSITETK